MGSLPGTCRLDRQRKSRYKREVEVRKGQCHVNVYAILRGVFAGFRDT